ncbi:protein NTM1-like 9 isoform X2 [Andrographis paniculata]|uniref:protein NTM1-like 9 isoform X2 n=1 Tax=Andrographis paniculata TaxID=175694 RepID=UPI0021E6EC23|nr:protein NTM1-like 9 isoform X2 [Andrographis paniculata]
MCPPANYEIGLYWTDQQIIALLDGYIPGSRLPRDVLTDSNPYLCPPSNLPGGMWYLVRKNVERESDYGFWRARDEACKIYSSSTITGWRITLDFFEGKHPPGKRTGWLMQEYSITQNGFHVEAMPQISRMLCRVFPCIDNEFDKIASDSTMENGEESASATQDRELYRIE